MSNNVKETPQTPEAVAYQLMDLIFTVEGKKSTTYTKGSFKRQDILETYKECLAVVKG